MDSRRAEGLIRVIIKDPRGPFDKSVGSIVGSESDGCTLMYRVRLDKPVKVSGLDRPVADDLWAGDYLELLSHEEDSECYEEEGD